MFENEVFNIIRHIGYSRGVAWSAMPVVTNAWRR